MKRIFKSRWLLAGLALATMAFFTRCEEDDATPQPFFVVSQDGYSEFNENVLLTQITSIPKEDLSVAETAGLLFMREEEKLAYDINTKMYEKWDHLVFNNISRSELTHTEAVLMLLEKYQLPDPVGDNGIGVFTDVDIQNLYDSLLAEGNLSEIVAFKVGAAIEEIDILDLDEQLLNVVDNQDIIMVYTNLQRASRNHLRAFVRNLQNRGITYEPQFLSQDVYDDIISGNIETGGN